MTKVEIKYYWKKITEDGLVKAAGPDSLNIYGQGYDSKEEAVADFCQYRKDNEWGSDRSLFLFEEYTVRVED